MRTGCVYEAITDNINLAGRARESDSGSVSSDQSKWDYERHILYS